jgi:hypothetical protein
MIQKVWQVDPLTCIHCGGKMKIIAFIQRSQQKEIQGILACRSIKMPDLKEIARGPPRWLAIQEAKAFVQAHCQAYPEENLDQTAHINEEDYFLNPP